MFYLLYYFEVNKQYFANHSFAFSVSVAFFAGICSINFAPCENCNMINVSAQNNLLLVIIKCGWIVFCGSDIKIQNCLISDKKKKKKEICVLDIFC